MQKFGSKLEDDRRSKSQKERDIELISKIFWGKRN